MITFLCCLASLIFGASLGLLLASLAVAAKIGDEKTEQTVKRVDIKV